jgi:hypothetical protein
VALALSVIGAGSLVAILGVAVYCLGRRDRARRAVACQQPVPLPGPLSSSAALPGSSARSLRPSPSRAETGESGYEWPDSLTREEVVSPFGPASVFYSASSQVSAPHIHPFCYC